MVKNLAYGCYLFFGLVSLWAAFWFAYALIIEGIHTNDLSGLHGYLGFLVIFPLFIPLLVALPVSLVLTLVQQTRATDFRLLFLLGLTFFLFIFLMIENSIYDYAGNPPWAIWLMLWTLTGYGLIAVGTSLRYYLNGETQQLAGKRIEPPIGTLDSSTNVDNARHNEERK